MQYFDVLGSLSTTREGMAVAGVERGGEVSVKVHFIIRLVQLMSFLNNQYMDIS